MKNKNEIEIKVILRALELLNESINWEPNSIFGEECELHSSKLTLGCALVKAQKDIRGSTENRSKEMGVLRRIIYFHYF